MLPVGPCARPAGRGVRPWGVAKRRGPARQVVWPVGRAQVAEAFGPLAPQVLVVRVRWERHGSVPLVASWSPPGSPRPGAKLWLEPIAAGVDPDLRAALGDALGDAAGWLRTASEAPEAWRAVGHERAWHLTASRLVVRDAEGTELVDRDLRRG